MDRGLIIKATSVQHLPLVLKKLKEQFPRAAFDILTHPNAIHSLDGSFKRENIILYGGGGCFSLRGILKEGLWKRLREKKYDFVVVPVENIHGSGYENVFKIALSTLPRQVIIVNRQGEVTIKSFLNCLRMLLTYAFLFPISLLVSLGLTLYFMIRLTSPMLKRAFRT